MTGETKSQPPAGALTCIPAQRACTWACRHRKLHACTVEWLATRLIQSKKFSESRLFWFWTQFYGVWGRRENAHTISSNSPLPTGCLKIHLNSDSIFLDIEHRLLRLRVQSCETAPHPLRCQSQVQVVPCVSEQRLQIGGSCHPLPGFG